jgi:hypothetical protein
MTPLLRRAATCAGLAAIGLAARSQAQIPTVKPEPIVGSEIRRAVPAAPPVVQQSPNGLYGLSITDAGIELRGPNGGLKITNTGIEIGDPNGRLTIRVKDMELRADGPVRLEGGTAVDIRTGTEMTIRASTTLRLMGGATAELTTGYASVKLEPAGTSLTGQTVTLGCPGGKPAARVGDVVNTGVTPAVIVQGSPKVLVC